MIHIYTGKGKGKTTAAIGLAVRAKGAGKKVCFIQFLKGSRQSSEIKMLKRQGIKTICFKEVHPVFNKCVSIFRLKQRIAEDLKTTERIIKEKKFNMVVLDEILYALKYKLISQSQLIKIIKQAPKKLELVLTGASAPAKIRQSADYISSIKDIKHPYKKSTKPRKGIEY